MTLNGRYASLKGLPLAVSLGVTIQAAESAADAPAVELPTPGFIDLQVSGCGAQTEPAHRAYRMRLPVRYPPCTSRFPHPASSDSFACRKRGLHSGVAADRSRDLFLGILDSQMSYNGP